MQHLTEKVFLLNHLFFRQCIRKVCVNSREYAIIFLINDCLSERNREGVL